MKLHFGRTWTGHPIEDECPCPQEPCGLIDFDRAVPECQQHQYFKTMRQGHYAENCPAITEE